MDRRSVRTALAGAALVVAAGCAAGGSGAETREVLVDHVHDELASSFIAYFPENVTVRPGDTVVFRQEWTGEPHSVTMGTMVDEMMGVVAPLIEEFGEAAEEPPPEVIEQYEQASRPSRPWWARART